MTAATTLVTHGTVASGFEAVRDVFDDNFARHGELGAAFAAVCDGEVVADLWGGTADAATGRAWERDTLGNVFSASKALAATCVLVLADRGTIDLDAPVAAYWPEFSAQGKGHVQVKDVMSHRARLPIHRAPVSHDDLTRPRELAALLAAQPQETDPRARFTYHGVTYGTLVGELVRRADGRTLAEVFAQEVAAPLGLELWLGLPIEHEPRVATLRYGEHWGNAPGLDPDNVRHDPLAYGLWHNPPLFPPGVVPWNAPELRAAEIPAAGAIGDARSMARLLGCLARGGAIGATRLLGDDAIRRGSRTLARGHDAIVGIASAYGVGFQLQTDRRHLGPPAGAFGHEGAGGSLHGAWPRERVGFSYIMNDLRDDPDADGRASRLAAALHESVVRAA
jgi:CubicO group peptidase (beta-lactamase class C family)